MCVLSLVVMGLGDIWADFDGYYGTLFMAKIWLLCVVWYMASVWWLRCCTMDDQLLVV